ncbi:helix-hairpin-helix domain-containing protein, partial [Thermococcus sp. GR7]
PEKREDSKAEPKVLTEKATSVAMIVKKAKPAREEPRERKKKKTVEASKKQKRKPSKSKKPTKNASASKQAKAGKTTLAEESSDLLSIKGIGPKTLKKLQTAGITSIEDLKKANPDEVAKKAGISPKILRKFIAQIK